MQNWKEYDGAGNLVREVKYERPPCFLVQFFVFIVKVSFIIALVSGVSQCMGWM